MEGIFFVDDKMISEVELKKTKLLMEWLLLTTQQAMHLLFLMH